MIIHILIIIALVALSIYAGVKFGIEKGINIGRMQVLEEDLIRMDQSNQNSSDMLTEQVNTLLNSKTTNHSREACRYVESEKDFTDALAA